MNSRNWDDVIDSLAHVFWIGGGPCAGKSTISTRLSSDFGFVRYDGDAKCLEHLKLATPKNNSVGFRVHSSLKQGELLTWFVDRPGKEQAKDNIEWARCEFEFVIDDLLTMPRDEPIVVDAFPSFPQTIFKATSPQHAVFLVSTDDFQRNMWAKREWHKKHLESCSDPESALDQWMDCQFRLSRYIADDCKDRGAALVITGGHLDIEQVYETVKKHFNLEG
jgi:hypothetical protein